MGVSRRDFLKLSGSSLVLGALSAEPSPAEAKERELRTKGAKETRTVCPFCSVGCGIIVHTKDGKVVYTEGDQDHLPVLFGGLRHHRPHEGRQGGEHRGRPRASDQRGDALPERRVDHAAGA